MSLAEKPPPLTNCYYLYLFLSAVKYICTPHNKKQLHVLRDYINDLNNNGDNPASSVSLNFYPLYHWTSKKIMMQNPPLAAFAIILLSNLSLIHIQ